MTLPSHTFLPSLSNLWDVAVREIDRSVTLPLKNDRTFQLHSSHPFPPPTLFLHENTQKALAFLACYAMIRNRWIGYLFGTSVDNVEGAYVDPPKDRVWAAEFRRLAMLWFSHAFHTTFQDPYASGSKQTRKSVKRRDDAVTAKAGETFDFLDVNPTVPAEFSLGRMQILRESNIVITPSVAQMLLWDISQCNVHVEFILVDRTLRRDLWDSSDVEVSRQEQVNGVFAGGMETPLCPAGEKHVDLGGPMLYRDDTVDYELRCERVTHLNAFQLVLRDWPHAAEIPVIMKDIDWAKESEFDALQWACYKLYCQSFFNMFGRAPTVPRHLPDDWR